MSQIDQENMKETISALLDNEADDLELRRFLKACEQDPTLLATWERFSLAQSVLHEPAHAVNTSLSQRIAAQIEQEAPLAAASTAPSQTYWKDGLTKMAIAASVAAVFLVTVQVNLDTGSQPAATPILAEQSVESIQSPISEPFTATALLAEASSDAEVVNGGIVAQYIESLTLDDKEPVIVEQMQNSPLFRLVNEMRVKP